MLGGLCGMKNVCSCGRAVNEQKQERKHAGCLLIIKKISKAAFCMKIFRRI